MTKRNANIDLARICATLFVIILHILGNGNILPSLSPAQASFWVSWGVQIGALCSVNVFALISGYVMCEKEIKLKNIFGLWLQVFFYSLLISGLFFGLVPASRSLPNMLRAIFPVLGAQWWYISAYIALFFCMPLLNAAIQHLNRSTFQKFLLAILLGVGVLNSLSPTDVFSLVSGYSAAWLILMYLLGAYIRKYGVSEKWCAAKCLLGFLGAIALTLLSKAALRYGTQLLLGHARLENLFISYTSITIISAAVFFFLFCLNVKLSPFVSKAIVFLAPTTLSVYLIHVHPLVLQFFFDGAFSAWASKSTALLLASVFGTALAVFLLCSAVDLLRIRLFKWLRINNLCAFVGVKASAFYARFFKK